MGVASDASILMGTHAAIQTVTRNHPKINLKIIGDWGLRSESHKIIIKQNFRAAVTPRKPAFECTAAKKRKRPNFHAKKINKQMNKINKQTNL